MALLFYFLLGMAFFIHAKKGDEKKSLLFSKEGSKKLLQTIDQ